MVGGERSIMLTDEINKMKEAGVHLEARRAGCKKCGQIIDVEVPTNWTNNLSDELATEMCGCWGSTEFCKSKKKRENAEETVNRQFGDLEKQGAITENITSLIHKIVDLILNEELKTASLDIGQGIKAKIGINSKGNVKIEKSITEKNSEEI